jgi:hypothetical protein
MSNSQKTSQFTALTTLSDSTSITLVDNGQNFTISFADFKTALGVTGTLTAIGDPLGTPILNVPTPEDYQIRTLESGAGVIASTSVNDGVSLSVNFSQDETGAQIISDLASSTTTFRSLVAGSGINVAEAGERIQISVSEIVASTKTVIISQESDFPDAVGGVITLEPLTKYQLVDDVSTANRFILQDRTVMSGDSGALSVLEYTGTGVMFTWVDAIVVFDNLRMNAPLASLFSGSSPTLPLGSFIIERCSIDSCDKIGTFGDMFAIRWDNATFINVITDGVLLVGNTSYIELESSFINQITGTLLDLGTSTFDGFNFTNSVVLTAGTATLLSGLPNSGNVNAGGIGVVVNNRSKGAINLVNISPNDALWQFALNDTIADTRPDTLLSFSTPTTTVLSAATPTLLTGTWVIERTSQMTGTVAGRSTYNAGKSAILPVTATISLEPVSGTNKDVNLYLAKNGTAIPNSRVATVISSGSPKTNQ